MGFRQDAYARVWSVDNKGNYSMARISISRRDKNTNTYTTDFQDGYVRLVGQAHNTLKEMQIDEKKGVSIKISSCEVTNVYTSPDGKVSYTPHYTIFGLELQDGNKSGENVTANSAQKSGSDGFMSVPDSSDEELPFS